MWTMITNDDSGVQKDSYILMKGNVTENYPDVLNVFPAEMKEYAEMEFVDQVINSLPSGPYAKYEDDQEKLDIQLADALEHLRKEGDSYYNNDKIWVALVKQSPKFHGVNQCQKQSP